MTNKKVIKLLNKLYLKADFTDEYGDMEDTEPYEEAIKTVTELLKQQPCEDYISRQAVLEMQTNYVEDIGATSFWQMRDDIRNLPPVIPQPKIGHWITQWNVTHQKEYYCCSECREKFSYDGETGIEMNNYNFCPNCGAKMEE